MNMQLEDKINISNSSDRVKAIANIQIRGHWFFSLFNKELKEFDITEVQFNILRILKGKHPKPLSAGEISKSLISQATDVTRVIDRMLKKGLVTRERPEENRRKVLISLTNEGLEKVENTKDVLNSIIEKTQVWTDGEVSTLNQLLNKLE